MGSPGGVEGLRRRPVLEADFPYQKGGPENPLSEEEVRAKFRGNAGLALGDAEIEVIEERILTLDEQRDLSAVLAPLTVTEVTTA